MNKDFTSNDKMWIRSLVKELPVHETSAETRELISTLDKSIVKIHSYFEEKGIIPEMHERVKNTNGRVKKLEIWKSFLLGGWAVASIVSIAVVPTIFYLYVQDVKNDINKSVDTRLGTKVDNYIDDNYELSK